jgi:hypothetical protein
VAHGPDSVRHIAGASGATPQPAAAAPIALPTQPPLRPAAPLRRRPGSELRTSMVGAGTVGRPAL